MKSRFRTLLIATVLVLLLSGLGSFLWIGLQSPLTLLTQGGKSVPTTAMFVPRRAPLAASLLVNPNRLVTLRQLLTAPGQRRQSRAEMKKIQDGLLASVDLEYERDIRPWLGDEATLAVTTLDMDRDPTNGQQPGYLLALATKDSKRARQFLQVYWQRRAADGTDLHYEQVQGVKLIYGDAAKAAPEAIAPETHPDPTDPQTIASALVGDRYLLFANAPKVLRDAVNNVQVPELNLANAPQYRRSLEVLTAPRVAFLYANLNALGGWLENQGLTINKTARDGVVTSGLYQGLALGLGITPQGLLADTALLEAVPVASEAVLAATETSPSGGHKPEQLLNYLPKNSIAVASSSHLDQLWAKAQGVLQAYPAMNTLVDRTFDRIQDDWSLDITQEIFPWVKGEYALAPIERPQGLDWIFVVDRTSPEAQAGIAHLDDLARDQGYSIGGLTLADREVTAWTQLKPEGQQASAANAIRALVRGVHASIDRYELFSTSLDAMEAVLQASENTALVDNRSFKQAIAPLPAENQGYFYLDWHNNQTLLRQDLPLVRILELTAQPLFQHLKAISLSGYENGSTAGIQRAAIALQLGQTP